MDGADEPLGTELVEVGGEVLEEVALERVISVVVEDLVAEGIGVVLLVGFDFLLDVDVLSVEIVLLCHIRGAEGAVERFACYGVIGFLGYPQRLCGRTTTLSGGGPLWYPIHSRDMLCNYFFVPFAEPEPPLPPCGGLGAELPDEPLPVYPPRIPPPA